MRESVQDDGNELIMKLRKQSVDNKEKNDLLVQQKTAMNDQVRIVNERCHDSETLSLYIVYLIIVTNPHFHVVVQIIASFGWIGIYNPFSCSRRVLVHLIGRW
jgi:hypothetical protein